MKFEFAALIGMALLALAGSAQGQEMRQDIGQTFGPGEGNTPVPGLGADILLNCSSCHIVRPQTAAEAARTRVPGVYPDLSGQPARYLERQLHAFRDGRRQHPQMRQTAISLAEGAAAMARLYADAPAPRRSPPTGDHAQALRLVLGGDWSRGIPPCASCHGAEPANPLPAGPEATGSAHGTPRLHGQPATYLSTQLRAYADGTRRSDPMGRMRAFSARLTPSEMTALAEYYAAWAPEASSGAPQENQQDGPPETEAGMPQDEEDPQ